MGVVNPQHRCSVWTRRKFACPYNPWEAKPEEEEDDDDDDDDSLPFLPLPVPSIPIPPLILLPELEREPRGVSSWTIPEFAVDEDFILDRGVPRVDRNGGPPPRPRDPVTTPPFSTDEDWDWGEPGQRPVDQADDAIERTEKKIRDDDRVDRIREIEALPDTPSEPRPRHFKRPGGTYARAEEVVAETYRVTADQDLPVLPKGVRPHGIRGKGAMERPLPKPPVRGPRFRAPRPSVPGAWHTNWTEIMKRIRGAPRSVTPFNMGRTGL